MSVLVIVAVGVLGAVVLIGVLGAVVASRGGFDAQRLQRNERTARVEGVVVDTSSQRRNVQETAFVDYYALVRFTGPDAQSQEAWLPTFLPPDRWQVPGQRVLVACHPANPMDAHVEQAL